jgi:hypothetical protein
LGACLALLFYTAFERGELLTTILPEFENFLKKVEKAEYRTRETGDRSEDKASSSKQLRV